MFIIFYKFVSSLLLPMKKRLICFIICMIRLADKIIDKTYDVNVSFKVFSVYLRI